MRSSQALLFNRMIMGSVYFTIIRPTKLQILKIQCCFTIFVLEFVNYICLV
jgi:hypothetical protein